MRVVLLTLVAILVLGGSAWAQSYSGYYPQEFLWGISWNVGIPTSNTKDYTDKTSFRGAGLEGRKFVKPDLTLGLSFSWNVFNEKSFRTDPVESTGGEISGTQFRTLNIFPLLANIHKYWGYYGGLRPYIGLGAGAYIIENRRELGLFSLQETNWHFGVAPEVGILMPSGRFLGFFNVRYNYTTSAGMTPEQSYLGFNVGLGLQ